MPSRLQAVTTNGHAAPAPSMRSAGIDEQPSTAIAGTLAHPLELRRGHQLRCRSRDRSDEPFSSRAGRPSHPVSTLAELERRWPGGSPQLAAEYLQRPGRWAVRLPKQLIERLAKLDGPAEPRFGDGRGGPVDQRPPLGRREETDELSPLSQLLEAA